MLGSSQQSSAIQKGQQQATMAQLYAQNQMRGDLGGYMTAGRNATDFAQAASGAQGQDNPLFRQNIALALSGNLGPEAAQGAMENFYTSPGYQFRLDEGLRAVDAGAAARGMLRSGATLKAEQAFGEGLAAQEYDKYFSRASDSFGNYYNRLFDLSRLGENAAAGVGAQGQASANAQSNIATGAAGAEARNIGNTTQGIQTGLNQLFNSKSFQGLFAPSTPEVAPIWGANNPIGTSSFAASNPYVDAGYNYPGIR
jgi:hypothetical protein